MRQHGGMLNGMPPIFVVSLVRETDRRARMQKELKARQLDFDFFDAVDGAELAESCYRHRMQEQWWRIMRGRRLSPGEIGCFLSHYALWQHLVDTGTPCAIVLEDDAVLEDGFPVIIDALLKTDWDVVLLSPKKRYPVHQELAVLDGQRFLVRYRRRVGTTVGYLIRREAAQALLHYCWHIRAPIDWLYAEWWRSGLAFCAVDPAIVTHAAVQPVIQTLPKVRRTMLQHAAAASYRLADWLYLRSVGSESLDMPPPTKPE